MGICLCSRHWAALPSSTLSHKTKSLLPPALALSTHPFLGIALGELCSRQLKSSDWPLWEGAYKRLNSFPILRTILRAHPTSRPASWDWLSPLLWPYFGPSSFFLCPILLLSFHTSILIPQACPNTFPSHWSLFQNLLPGESSNISQSDKEGLSFFRCYFPFSWSLSI